MAGDSGVIQLGIMWIVTGSRQRVRKSSRPESLPPPQLSPWECNGATDGSNLWDQTRPYEIVSPLGGGSMGEVCRARDPRLNLEVTIKVFVFGAIAFGRPATPALLQPLLGCAAKKAIVRKVQNEPFVSHE